MTTPSSESILISSHPPSLLAQKARSPLGGSLVIFTPFCKTCTGKLLAGIEVNHKRKPHRSSGPATGGNPHLHGEEMYRWQFLKVNKQFEITILAVDFCCSSNIPKTFVFFNFTQVLCLNLSRIFVYLLSNVWFRFHQGVKVCKHRENVQPLRNQAAGLHVVRVELFNNSFQGWHPRFHQVTWRICQASISRRSLNKQPTQGFKGWFTAVDSSEMKWKVDVWYVVQLPCYFECIYICHWFFSRIWKNKDFVVCFVFFVHSKFVHIISPPQVFFPWIPIHCISSK